MWFLSLLEIKFITPIQSFLSQMPGFIFARHHRFSWFGFEVLGVFLNPLPLSMEMSVLDMDLFATLYLFSSSRFVSLNPILVKAFVSNLSPSLFRVNPVFFRNSV